MVKIPLELIHFNDDGFHLLVEVVVLEQTYWAVLDTGASRSVLDKSIVESWQHPDLRLEESGVPSTGLGTNSMTSYALTVPEFQIGRQEGNIWKRRNYEFAVLDLSTINYAYQQMDIPTIIGVIGGDILAGFGAVIDYNKSQLRLRERARRRPL